MTNPREWFALTTMTGSEAAAAEEVVDLGIECYRPTFVREVRIGKYRIKRIVELPLLPGYLLAKVPMDSWRVVRRLKGVTGYLGANKTPCSIPNSEVGDLERRADLGIYDDVSETTKLIRGDLLDILTGPFEGMSGKFYKMDGGKVVVEIYIFGATRLVVLDSDMVRHTKC